MTRSRKNKKILKMFTKNKGFTLIEMLVVVAIVGILSATVLAALGPSRDKAKDARITSSIKQGLVIAESAYDSNSATHYSSIAANGDAIDASGVTNVEVKKLASDVANQGGALKISVANNSIAFYSTINSGGNYCSDSAGNTTSGTATGGVCQ